MSSISRRRPGLAALVTAAAGMALTLPLAAQAAPVQPGRTPHVNFGATEPAGNVTLKVSHPNKLGEADIYETLVKVCNRGSEPQPVGPDTFSYTSANNVTRMYSPHNGMIWNGMVNQYLKPGSCTEGSLVNIGKEPFQLAFYDLRTDVRYDILPATEWDGIFKVSDPRSDGTSNYFGDYSKDKVADVAAISKGKVVTYRTVTGPMLVSQGATGASGNFTWVGKAGDVDHNGATDLLLRDGQGTMWLQYMMGGNRAGFRTLVGYGWNNFVDLAVVNDVTGDGRPELVGRHKDGRLLRYNVKPVRIDGGVKIGSNWQGVTQLLSVGDISGDGRADVLAITKDGRLMRYNLTNKGTISGTKQVGHGWQQMSQAFSPGDMNSDGRRDMVGVRKDGNLYFYANRGNGNFAPAKKIGNNWTSITSMS